MIAWFLLGLLNLLLWALTGSGFSATASIVAFATSAFIYKIQEERR